MQSEWPSEVRSVCQAEWNLWLNRSGTSAHWPTLWTPERRRNSWCCCPVDTASGGRAQPGAEAFAPDKPGETDRMCDEAKEQETASSSPSCGLEHDEEEWLLVSAEQGMWGPGLCSEAANYSSGSFPPSSLEPPSSKENQERLCVKLWNTIYQLTGPQNTSGPLLTPRWQDQPSNDTSLSSRVTDRWGHRSRDEKGHQLGQRICLYNCRWDLNPSLLTTFYSQATEESSLHRDRPMIFLGKGYIRSVSFSASSFHSLLHSGRKRNKRDQYIISLGTCFSDVAE